MPETAIPIKPLTLPRFDGRNIIVEVDNEEYEKGVQQCQFDVIGRIILQKEMNPTQLCNSLTS